MVDCIQHTVMLTGVVALAVFMFALCGTVSLYRSYVPAHMKAVSDNGCGYVLSQDAEGTLRLDGYRKVSAVDAETVEDMLGHRYSVQTVEAHWIF
jgi:hypothetical protein